ncbi:MAG TPA: hypothetical protein VJR02_12765 [Pyrinomonadaceae bacterium]|nr:hypothetical protein [Pyrinomonadaceae bacterium]
MNLTAVTQWAQTFVYTVNYVMSSATRAIRKPDRTSLLNLLASEFHNPAQVFDLIDGLLSYDSYDRSFCKKLISICKQRTGLPWNLRRIATLVLENQVLKIDPEDLDTFDSLLVQLDLKQRGLKNPLNKSVLKEGYTSTDIRRFVPEFRRRLERLAWIHDRIVGQKTSHAVLRDFFSVSRQHCKLTLARYLCTPQEIVNEIIRQIDDTAGVRDVDLSEIKTIKDEIKRSVELLPDFEGEILRRLSQTGRIYWVSERTSSRLNSLVEYPLTTVVLVIKPPGSDIEFEIKRAGLRGENSLSVIYARNRYTVPPSHRLNGGSMQWLLRYEADAAIRLNRGYRQVHGVDAPIPAYIARSFVYTIPTRNGAARTMDYFTQRHLFGSGFNQMRAAMRDSVEAFASEGHGKLPPLADGVSLAAQFIAQVTPGQAILTGTTAFRLDKIESYLLKNGPERYFKAGLGVDYSADEAKQLADTVLEEILGVYRPPDVRYRNHEQYVAAALSANRARADEVYLSIVEQIAKFWGTLFSLRVHTRGESFVARNVGLKSCWKDGEWKVKIIFMDHDAVTLHGPDEHFFFADSAIPTIALDESYIWSRNPRHFPGSQLGYLQRIYQIDKAIDQKGDVIARRTLRDVYVKTRSALQANDRLRRLYHKRFLERYLDWDIFVNGYLGLNGEKSANKRWKQKMEEKLTGKGYKTGVVERMGETVEKNRKFLEKYSFLFEPPY